MEWTVHIDYSVNEARETLGQSQSLSVRQKYTYVHNEVFEHIAIVVLVF